VGGGCERIGRERKWGRWERKWGMGFPTMLYPSYIDGTKHNPTFEVTVLLHCI